jgi:hypothetical protein
VHSHPNAHLTPRGRARVFAAVEAGMTVSATPGPTHRTHSTRTNSPWLPRQSPRAQQRIEWSNRASVVSPGGQSLASGGNFGTNGPSAAIARR